MSNYKFVHDVEQVRQFYDQIIAPHVGIPSRSFILLPIARNKYWSGLSKSQQTVSSRTIYTENLTFEHFLNLLRRYEVVEGLYTDKGVPMPSHAFAFYITCDPMDEVKSMFSLVKDFNNAVFEQLQVNQKDQSDHSQTLRYNGSSKYKSILHQNPIKSFVKFDVDTKDPELIQSLETFLENNQIPISLRIESKNGYHYLIKKEAQCKALHLWSKAKEQKDWFSIENNALVIIPGTYQGGFPTRIAESPKTTNTFESASAAKSECRDTVGDWDSSVMAEISEWSAQH